MSSTSYQKAAEYETHIQNVTQKNVCDRKIIRVGSRKSEVHSTLSMSIFLYLNKHQTELKI